MQTVLSSFDSTIGQVLTNHITNLDPNNNYFVETKEKKTLSSLLYFSPVSAFRTRANYGDRR